MPLPGGPLALCRYLAERAADGIAINTLDLTAATDPVAAGLDGTRLTSHSLRAGHAVQALENTSSKDLGL